MSLFEKLFGKDKQVDPPKTEPKTEGVPWFSNAPQDWMPLTARAPSRTGGPMELLAFFNRFADIFTRSGRDLKVVDMMSHKLVEAGVLTVPFHVTVDGIEYYIMVYLADPQESADQFLTVSRLHESGQIPKPLWFAPFELPPAKKAGELSLFSFRDFRLVKEGAKKGQYATWWQTNEESSFVDSPICEQLNAIYTASNPYYSYLMAMLLQHALGKNDASRTALPVEPLSFPFTLPNDIHAILSVSQEKGIQLFFHKETTSIGDVRLVFKHYRNLVELLTQHLSERNCSKDSPTSDGSSPLDWWKMVYALARKKQSEGEAIQQIGLFQVDGGPEHA